MEFLDHVFFPGLFVTPTISEAFGDRHAVPAIDLAIDRMAALIGMAGQLCRRDHSHTAR
jgi:hypothetical protein